MREPRKSGALKLLQLVWDHNQETISHSWLKLNHSMHSALFLALHSGMRFGVGDFEYMSKNFRLGYWCGDLEYFYREAVVYRNASAYHMFESHRDRKAFRIAGASVSIHTGDGPAGQGLERIVIGAEFRWKGERVKVTSFNDDDGSFTACSYVMVGENKVCSKCKNTTSWGREKIHHRFKINHAAIREAKKEAKDGTDKDSRR